ncbi:MAG: hypothetical protein KJ967_06365 [Elusimicrobia bacterium]|nr:hypothetical protein [Elusimicrobiota bacterium]
MGNIICPGCGHVNRGTLKRCPVCFERLHFAGSSHPGETGDKGWRRVDNNLIERRRKNIMRFLLAGIAVLIALIMLKFG